MRRLILTTSDSGAGCLKAARMADRVVAFAHRLVSGPVPPATNLVTFFAAREELLGADIDDWARESFGFDGAEFWKRLIDDCADCQHIEIWADPAANAQLQMIQLLTWLGDTEGRLSLVHAASPIGEHSPEEIVRLDLRAHPVGPAHLDLARRCIAALQQPTPESWFALLFRDELEIFPHLRPAVLRLLEELPSSETALSLTEAKLLSAISRGVRSPLDVIAAQIEDKLWAVFDHCELGAMLDSLARGNCPAVTGIDGPPFGTRIHDDALGFEQYRKSSLSLSPLGWELVHRRADVSRFRFISRWWGGTRLSNDRLWRWDHVGKSLVPPS
jgi:hypothetical protein